MIMRRYTYTFVDGIVAKKSALQEIVANNQQLYTNRPVSDALGPAISFLRNLLFFLDNLMFWSDLSCHTLVQCSPPDVKNWPNYRADFPQNRVAFPQHRFDWAANFHPLWLAHITVYFCGRHQSLVSVRPDGSGEHQIRRCVP